MKISSSLDMWDSVTRQLAGKHRQKPISVLHHHRELIKVPLVLWSEEFLIMKEDVRVLRAVADFLTPVAAVRQWASVCLWIREQRRKWRWAQMCNRLDRDFFSQFSACQMPVCPHKHWQTSTSTQPVISCLTRKTWNACTFYESNHSLHIKH